MVLIALKCPNCNGDIQLDNRNEFGFCMYCGSKVFLERADKVTIDRSVQVENSLKVAKDYIEDGDYDKASSLIEDILISDSDCSDAYFMRAFLSKSDDVQYSRYVSKGRELANNNHGIFTEVDIERYWGSDVYIMFITDVLHIKPTIKLLVDGKYELMLYPDTPLHIGLRKGSHFIETSFLSNVGKLVKTTTNISINKDIHYFRAKFTTTGMTLVETNKISKFV